MSKTVEELVKIGRAARTAYIMQHQGVAGVLPDAERAATIAIVRALRDDIWTRIGCVEASDIMNEILGDAGSEKVAGACADGTVVQRQRYGENDRQSKDGAEVSPRHPDPATDYSRKQCDNCDWPSLPECRKCGYPFAATPATDHIVDANKMVPDPAPAVCEFRGRPGRYIRSCNGARSIYNKPFPPEACAFCKKPVKFTEAKT